MKILYTILCGICLLYSGFAFGQEAVVTGRLLDGDSQQPLPGVSVRVKGTQQGVSSDVDGSFRLSLKSTPATIIFSYIGFESQEKEIQGSGSLGDFIMKPSLIFMADQVVISGTRQAEKITKTPATIQLINSKSIEELPSFNPGELLSRVKGVEFVRSGVIGTGINIRGFNSNFNSKNLQVNDGRFATLIATGLPLGPLSTFIKEDIDRVEVILGPNAALYGPNAHNGLVNTIMKDPRASQGTTIALGAGNQNMLTARVRHAQVLNDKFAFRVSGEYTKGTEFDFVDSVYMIRGGSLGAYEELELDNDFSFLKGNASLVYNITERAELVATWGGSNTTYLAPTNVGRNQIKDWKINHYGLKLISEHWFAQAYYTTSKTDSTYSIDERTKQYYRGIDSGLTDNQARGAFSYQSGALFIDDSRRLNGEIQYNNSLGKLNIVVGAQGQRDMANSHGTYLLDKDEDDYITINQFGVYGQFDYDLGNGFKLTAVARGDYHEVYEFNFVPKAGLVKSVGKDGAIRLTYSKGIAAPTILNMYGNLFNGLILGNAEGFTLNDGSAVEKQKVEEIQTIELGYKGKLNNRLYTDINAYYNKSKNFLSPVTVVGVATERGDQPMSEVQDGYGVYGGLVATYVNFGEVNTFGFDIGLNYQLMNHLTLDFNYSFFDYSVDEDDLDNDFDKDGKVTKLDILVNSPKNRAGLGLNYSGNKFFGTVFARWVEEYDYFSSFQIAAKSQPELSYRGVPIKENARSADTWNYGPLGGFVDVDLSLGYHIIQNKLSLSGQVTNPFDAEFREFTASPFIGRLYSVQLKLDLPAISKKTSK
ncbi:TonB-dependent receptor [Fulvivirga ligni]|uniref:TonB-dependent receptor n=1 Tax=Fulvivirga ligni TaxID=2904246 RepID=UPI001F3DD3C0|nr:TonB-dependent receptor [Fulvivirga ligni]UII20892.1 TonB-dependent receptor [Fulvivirga ligni]